MPLDAREFALKAAGLLQDKKAQAISLLEIGKLSLIADYFLICSGSNKIQTRSICDHLRESLPDDQYPLLRVEGYEVADWILLDFGALIVHIFQPETRSFYNLERLWGNAGGVDQACLTTLNWS
ncbi:MAG: ribosome silencing factor [Bacillota bacterium]